MKKFKNIFFIIKNILRQPIDLIKKNKISFSTRISSNTKISHSIVGRYCYVANNVNIVNSTIGNYCSIAPGVQIGGMEHSHWWYSTSTFLSDYCQSNNRTLIEDDVWIAAGAIIAQGVTIGRGSVVGAMSFVNKDVPPNSLVVGVPAKFLRNKIDDKVFKKLEESEYWKFNPSKAKLILENLKI